MLIHFAAALFLLPKMFNKDNCMHYFTGLSRKGGLNAPADAPVFVRYVGASQRHTSGASVALRVSNSMAVPLIPASG